MFKCLFLLWDEDEKPLVPFEKSLKSLPNVGDFLEDFGRDGINFKILQRCFNYDSQEEILVKFRCIRCDEFK